MTDRSDAQPVDPSDLRKKAGLLRRTAGVSFRNDPNILIALPRQMG